MKCYVWHNGLSTAYFSMLSHRTHMTMREGGAAVIVPVTRATTMVAICKEGRAKPLTNLAWFREHMYVDTGELKLLAKTKISGFTHGYHRDPI
jgi:hypothetical protein